MADLDLVSTEPEAEKARLLALITEVSDEINALGDCSAELRAYRIDLCRQAKAAGITTNALGTAAKVSGPAVTQWLQQTPTPV